MPLYIISNEIMRKANCFKIGYSGASQISLLKQYRLLYYPEIYCWIPDGTREMEQYVLKELDKQRLLNGNSNKSEWVIMELSEIIRIVAKFMSLSEESENNSESEDEFWDPVFPDFNTYDEPQPITIKPKKHKGRHSVNIYKEWILENPPRRNDTPTKYREKMIKGLKSPITAHYLSKLLKKLGYVGKNGNGARYWELEDSDSDSD